MKHTLSLAFALALPGFAAAAPSPLRVLFLGDGQTASRDHCHVLMKELGRDAVWFDYAPGRRVLAAPDATIAAMAAAPDAAAARRVEQAWWSADIADGLPQVFAGSSGAFVPQMLNLDLLDGISFAKGCYTGQEIVARTQNLGRIKRRTARFRVPTGPQLPPLAGLALDGEKVAEVVMSAPRGDAAEMLAVTSLEAWGRTLLADDGREAVPLALPYPVASAVG